jgi:hypothetical protein
VLTIEVLEVADRELLGDHLFDQPRLEHDTLWGVQTKGLFDKAGKAANRQVNVLVHCVLA